MITMTEVSEISAVAVGERMKLVVTSLRAQLENAKDVKVYFH